MSRSAPPDRRISARRGCRLATAGAGLAVAFHLWGLYRPSAPPQAGLFPGADKILHAAGFALPVILITVAYGLRCRADGRPPMRRVPAVIGGVLVVHAVVSELIQHRFYLHRAGDPLDVVADWIGIAVGGLVVWRLGYLRPIGPERRAPAPANGLSERG
ncbi:MAG TPA: hypothetical protein VLJ88_15430 [Propionibacteriaceae bacterium]|nr:hypothetical protein [Propionibacteriaceae bacterium]